MGIFSRFKDIVNSNINSILDKAEEPEKMIKLMIREMEDTLIEIKSACAGAMAQNKKIERGLEQAISKEKYWAEKAALAVSKNRDDLAREALLEKRRYSDKSQKINEETVDHTDLIKKYKDDIRQLEDKLESAREKQRTLIQRHIHASKKIMAQNEIRKMDSSETFLKFEEFQSKIERMESEADLVNYGKKDTLEDKFNELLTDEDIEKELEELKNSQQISKNDEN